jgi:hypothetical protein
LNTEKRNEKTFYNISMLNLMAGDEISPAGSGGFVTSSWKIKGRRRNAQK